jgi:hypothetical protein
VRKRRRLHTKIKKRKMRKEEVAEKMRRKRVGNEEGRGVFLVTRWRLQ